MRFGSQVARQPSNFDRQVKRKIIVVGSGNAALCAGIAALENSAEVLLLEKASDQDWGGNSRYTAGAMRFAYESFDDLRPLLKNPADERLARTDFGAYPKSKFRDDLQHFNEGKPLDELQLFLVEQSLPTMLWLASHGVRFSPIYSRQAFQKNGRHVFWGGLTLESEGEGEGLVQAERAELLRLGGKISYGREVHDLILEQKKVVGVRFRHDGQDKEMSADAVILGCGGFEANQEWRRKYLGENWSAARVRGTCHNLGQGIEMAARAGAAMSGDFSACHATPMDLSTPEFGNPDLPHVERKHYRKISYLFGVMLNADGERFVDEGADFRNYTYAQYGSAILEQPGGVAWQFFDAKVLPLLYEEYKTPQATFFEAASLEKLVEKLEGIKQDKALRTLRDFNAAVLTGIPFDPTVKDGRRTEGLALPKSNWSNPLDTPPFRAYPVTGGITFTYGGVRASTAGQVLNENGEAIEGLFACGEMVGGVFFGGYPGGSGLTSGAVFGRMAGRAAAIFVAQR